MASHCFGSAQVCAIRVARLTPSCEYTPSATSSVATSAIVRVAASPDYSAGEDFEMKNGCGQICISMKNCDQLKRMNLQLELCTRDPQLVELLTGASLIVDGTDTIGYSRRGIGSACPDPVTVEIWTKAVGVNNTCPPVSVNDYTDARWWRTVWPKATFTLGDVSFANEIATLQMQGFAESNPNYDDWFGDIPAGITLDGNSPEHMFLDIAGPPTSACGYIPYTPPT